MKYTRSIFIIIIIEQIREYPSILFDDINILDIRSLDSKRKKEKGDQLIHFFPSPRAVQKKFRIAETTVFARSKTGELVEIYR